jgi:hypothetical protein
MPCCAVPMQLLLLPGAAGGPIFCLACLHTSCDLVGSGGSLAPLLVLLLVWCASCCACRTFCGGRVTCGWALMAVPYQG